MERSTQNLTTPNGHEVVLYDYITGREQRQIQEVFLSKMQIKAGAEVSGFNASAASEAQDVAISVIVSLLDGKREEKAADGTVLTIVDRVLNLPAEDTQAIIEAINEITEPK